MDNTQIKIRLSEVSFFYGKRCVLDRISAGFEENAITAIVGPSGQGKSSLLMLVNRLWEEIPGARVTGRVDIRSNHGLEDVCSRKMPVDRLRRRVGMVFQEPNPLPMSIFNNVAFPLKLAGVKQKDLIASRVRLSLERAHLWDEVKNRMDDDGRTLSGGQQQRLCIARALILKPEVMLLDEPTASLDATAGGVIESLMLNLKSQCTMLVVSHYMGQVNRVADHVMALRQRRLLKV